MKRQLLGAFVIAVALVMSGCGAGATSQTDPTRNLSAQGKAAYQTTKVVKALDVLRDVAAEGEKQNPKRISASSALKILAYHKQVVSTMGAVPDGWKTVALTGLDQLKTDLTPAEWAQIEPFVTLLKTLYAAFVPGGALPSPAELQATLFIDERLIGGI